MKAWNQEARSKPGDQESSVVKMAGLYREIKLEGGVQPSFRAGEFRIEGRSANQDVSVTGTAKLRKAG